MVKIFIGLISFFSLFISSTSFAFINVSATVDKNPVIVNESFVLTVTADDDVNSNALDTSPLMTDFIVGRTSISSQTSMVNFKTTRTTRWTTVLIARKPGQFVIPALNIESNMTAPIALTVLAASDSQASSQQDLFITTDISAKEVYVQQQLTLTVKLHFAAELKRGSLTEPTLNGANILQIGKDKEEDTIINGRRYRVIERTYAISPQESGNFTLKSPVFSGEIMQPSTRRNGFLSFAETKPVSVIGDDIPLTILPIPTQYQGAWLPSELLTIHQEWQPSANSFVVGEPITRIITLTAAGLSEEQLPEILMTVPKGLKVYPDQAELHTGMNNNRLVSQKVRNFAIVANKPGTYELPAITIPWWNTVTNKYQEATLPAQTITVAVNPDLANEAPVVLETERFLNESAQVPTTQVVTVIQTPWLQWLFLALWIITSLAWLLTYLLKNKTQQKSSTKAPISDHYLALLAACKKNDQQKVFVYLAPWFNTITTQNISTVSQVIQHCHHQGLINAINELQRCFYSKEQQPWSGNNLLIAVNDVNKQPQPSSQHSLSINP